MCVGVGEVLEDETSVFDCRESRVESQRGVLGGRWWWWWWWMEDGKRGLSSRQSRRRIQEL
jgi:hypothetical protein